MPRFTPRFVIKHVEHTEKCQPKCQLGYYTEHKVVSTRPVRFNGNLLGNENVYAPAFDGAQQRHASQLGDREYAEQLLANKDEEFGPAGCFDGCVIEENTQEQE